MYLLTTCASCAAPLDSKGAKQCSRCKTRFDETVQIALGRANWSMFHAVVANTTNFAHICFVRECMRSLALPLLKNKRYDEGYRDHLREAVHDLMGLSDAVVEWEQWGQYHSIRDTLRLALTHQLDWSLEDLDLSPSQAEYYMDQWTKPSPGTTSSEDDA